MSPRPSSSAARVSHETDDFEWPPTADELSVYDVGPDPWQSVHVAASDAFQTRRRESLARPAPVPRVPGVLTRPAVARVSWRLVAAIAGAVAVGAVVTGWRLFRAAPLPVRVETVHHPAPAAEMKAPPRLKIVATYQVDPAPFTAAPAQPTKAGAAAPAVDAPRIPVTTTAAHQALAGVSAVEAPVAPIAGGAPAVVTPEDGIRSLLRRYEDAYDRRDVAAAAALWPSLDRPALTRAFDGLAGQDVHFDRCEVDATAARGSAVCVGTVRYRPSVGNGAERADRITWTFDLARSGGDWQIDGLSAR